MKSHEMREMTLAELKVHQESLLDELVTLRIKLAMRQIDNPIRVRYLKREVARTHTIIREKSLGAQPGEKPGASADSAA